MVDTHESSLVKQDGGWTLIESSEVTRARSALAEESRFVSTLLDATTALVVTLDAEGRVMRCNRACERLAGVPRAEIEGRFAWETIDIEPQRILDLVAEGGRRSFESTVMLRSGEEIEIAWSTAEVRDARGKSRCLVVTGQDITEHKRSQQRLQEAYELEHRVARTLQESLLRPIPEIGGLEAKVAYRPAVEAERVGGDFYDIFEPAPGRVAVIVGDVSGKGVEAAGLTETVRSMLRALLHVGLSPSEALTRAGRALYDQTPPERFATVAVTLLDLGSGEVRYASAGHPAPLLIDGDAGFADVPEDVPLGAFPHHYEETRLDLPAGAALVIYTDGLADARDGDEFFCDGALLAAAEGCGADPEALVHDLLDAAEAFSARPLSDDIAVVALRRVP